MKTTTENNYAQNKQKSATSNVEPLILKNALSVDVEEYFHAHNLKNVAPRSQWSSLPSRIEYSTNKTLELFDEYSVKATFFILGYIARRHPGLVKEIAQRGHEIASHGYMHNLAFKQTPKAFLRDIRTSKQLLEDISGCAVYGYRAPSFSVSPKNKWAYDAIAEANYMYDSSLYPIYHPTYGNKTETVSPFKIKQQGASERELLVCPLAVSRISLFNKNYHLPAAGGAYWRLLPKAYLIWTLKRINEQEHRPFVCYFHPWELDVKQKRFHQLPYLTQLRHYGGINGFESKIKFFLSKFNFGTVLELVNKRI